MLYSLFIFLIFTLNILTTHSLICDISEYRLALLKNNQQYEIHGLWPEICCNIKGYPEYCKNVTFNITEIESLLPKLYKYWYPTTNSTLQLELMKHEYLKHGSCTYYSLFDYFNNTLCLYFIVNINQCYQENCYFNFTSSICNLIYLC